MAAYYAVNPYDVSVLKVRLQAEIQAHDEPGLWMALVDTAFDHGNKPPAWLKAAWPVYHQDKLAAMQSVSPVLLELPSVHDAEFEPALARLLTHCCGRPMLSFLRIAQPPQSLREAWQKTLQVVTKDGLSFVLRFADTRTLPSIAAILAHGAWTSLSHGVDQWLSIDREGNLQQLQVAGADAPCPQTVDQLGKISSHISDKDLAQLLKQGQADALAGAFEEHFPDLLMPQSQGATMYQQLNAICALAEKHNIEAFPNVMSLAVSVVSSEGALLHDADFEHWLQQREWVAPGLARALADHFEPETAAN